jgi:hypothetical protein
LKWDIQVEEGVTEKAARDELSPKLVNGVKNGMNPSHAMFVGEKTDKGGAPETGRPFSPTLVLYT